MGLWRRAAEPLVKNLRHSSQYPGVFRLCLDACCIELCCIAQRRRPACFLVGNCHAGAYRRQLRGLVHGCSVLYHSWTLHLLHFGSLDGGFDHDDRALSPADIAQRLGHAVVRGPYEYDTPDCQPSFG